jgi:diketogulonate reductase-like aldo/keto reductase
VHHKSAAQVALRWVVQQGVVAVTASEVASYDVGDLDIFGFELTAAEMKNLSAI